MGLLISRTLLTLVIGAMAYFALQKVWTEKIDLVALLRGPSEGIPVVEERIIINPSTLQFTPNKLGNVTQLVEVRNTSTKETAYSIWLKMMEETGKLDPNKLQITIENMEDFLAENTGKSSTKLDSIMLFGKDSKGRRAIYISLYRIRNSESKTLKIKRIASEQNDDQPLVVTLVAKGFASEPAEIVTKPRFAGLAFSLPETFTVEGMGMNIEEHHK